MFQWVKLQHLSISSSITVVSPSGGQLATIQVDHDLQHFLSFLFSLSPLHCAYQCCLHQFNILRDSSVKIPFQCRLRVYILRSVAECKQIPHQEYLQIPLLKFLLGLFFEDRMRNLLGFLTKISQGQGDHFLEGEAKSTQIFHLVSQSVCVCNISSIFCISKRYDMKISCNGRRIETCILVISPSHSKNMLGLVICHCHPVNKTF